MIAMTLVLATALRILHADDPGVDSKMARGRGWYSDDGGTGKAHLMLPATDIGWTPWESPDKEIKLNDFGRVDIGLYPLAMQYDCFAYFKPIAKVGYSLPLNSWEKGRPYSFGVAWSVGAMFSPNVGLTYTYSDHGTAHHGIRLSAFWGWRGPVRLMP